MNLVEVGKQSQTEEVCLDYLEHSRWPQGVCCIKCGARNVSRILRGLQRRNFAAPSLLLRCSRVPSGAENGGASL